MDARHRSMIWLISDASRDNLTSHETITAFAKAYGAELTVMDGGEHWFHTDEQMHFLNNWIINGRSIR